MDEWVDRGGFVVDGGGGVGSEVEVRRPRGVALYDCGSASHHVTFRPATHAEDYACIGRRPHFPSLASSLHRLFPTFPHLLRNCRQDTTNGCRRSCRPECAAACLIATIRLDKIPSLFGRLDSVPGNPGSRRLRFQYHPVDDSQKWIDGMSAVLERRLSRVADGGGERRLPLSIHPMHKPPLSVFLSIPEAGPRLRRRTALHTFWSTWLLRLALSWRLVERSHK